MSEPNRRAARTLPVGLYHSRRSVSTTRTRETMRAWSRESALGRARARRSAKERARERPHSPHYSLLRTLNRALSGPFTKIGKCSLHFFWERALTQFPTRALTQFPARALTQFPARAPTRALTQFPTRAPTRDYTMDLCTASYKSIYTSFLTSTYTLDCCYPYC